jgi:3-dehydroquinate synthase
MPATFQLHDCPIFVGSSTDSFPQWLDNQYYSQVFIITDANTEALCLPGFLHKTGLSPKQTVVVIEPGEAQKNLGTCETIWQAMRAANLDRKALVINLGGGVIGDMGGFCAATWKRGIDFVQVPTTLLAMTDAAIGGKLGIDFQGLKNIIGVFRQPAAVFVDPDFLDTLPERELRSGYAEVIKHALIGDPELWAQLSDHHSAKNVLEASIGVKVRIVQEDPHEKGLRMLLNFGHTIGHALESWFLETDNPLTHGEAIAIGMICELEGSERRDAVAAFIKRVFPDRHIPESAFSAIWALMQQDKKNAFGKVRMALPDVGGDGMRVVELSWEGLVDGLKRYNANGL